MKHYLVQYASRPWYFHYSWFDKAVLIKRNLINILPKTWPSHIQNIVLKYSPSLFWRQTSLCWCSEIFVCPLQLFSCVHAYLSVKMVSNAFIVKLYLFHAMFEFVFWTNSTSFTSYLNFFLLLSQYLFACFEYFVFFVCCLPPPICFCSILSWW